MVMKVRRRFVIGQLNGVCVNPSVHYNDATTTRIGQDYQS